jgi:two-component system, cell cycle sensor histidine kinase and response regulator CckA
MIDGTSPPSGSTVLLTDDDLGVRTLIGFVLERAGFRVLQAGTGREALDVVRQRGQEVDAVLLDVMMPEMNGPEALPHLRNERPDLPVVFFSGFDRNQVADHLLAPSAYTSFVPKPCDNDELVAELRRAIDSSR